jgi:two-component system chemotaxis sensor kinase CheA
MGKFRDGVPATNDAVTLILATIDRIKQILESLEREQCEPEGVNADLISDLRRMVERVTSSTAPTPAHYTVRTLTPQVFERPLRPGEDSLDDLERAFCATAGEPPAARPAKLTPADVTAKDDDAAKAAGSRSASPSIRSNT